MLVAGGACLDLGVESPSVAAACDGGDCADGGTGGTGDASDTSIATDGAVNTGCGPGQIATDAGTCVGACVGTVCGAHTVCGSDGITCACVTGYAKNATGDCTFAGGPLDPGFSAQPAVWTFPADAGMVYSPTASGGTLVDPGQLAFPASYCDRGSVSQTFAMPTFAEAEPLALDVAAVNPGFTSPSPPFDYTTFYSVGDKRVPLIVTATHARVRTCLGDLAFGGNLTLNVTHRCGAVALDHVGIVADPVCPAPGQVGNGDFEGVAPETAWTAVFGASVATDGNSVRGILTTNSKCNAPTLRGASGSVKSGVAQALAFRLEGPNTPPLRVGFGTSSSGSSMIGEVSGTNAIIDARVCVPAWSRGMAWPVTFWIPKVGDGSDCSARTGTLKVDDVRLVDDATCSSSGYVFDGDFESSGGARYGYMEETGGPLVLGNGPGSGKALAFTVNGYPSGVTRTAALLVSLPELSGMALKFRYLANGNSTGAGTHTASFVIPGGGGALTEGPAQDFSQCIAKVPGGAPALLKFKIYASDNYTNESLEVDNVRFEPDSACP